MSCVVLSIVPYQVLPANTGGRQGIATMQHYLGRECDLHMVSTISNVPDDAYSFHLHRLLAAGKKRYLPFAATRKIVRLARSTGARAVYVDHPYMAFTAGKVARLLKAPLYLRAHNIEAERFRSMGKRWWPLMFVLERYAMRLASGVFFVTREDKDLAKAYYGIPEERCHVAPFGTPLERTPEGRETARLRLATDLQLPQGVPILYFIGVLDYEPNYQAVAFILREIMPRLEKKGARYEVVIAGKGLPEGLQQEIKAAAHIRYAGFVPDLETFLLGCDVMLNPVLTGGGIKTKVVEALAYSKTVVSTTTGAAGLEPEVCGNNLRLSADHDWDRFTENIMASMNTRAQIPVSFYGRYYWGSIAKQVKSVICQGL